MKCPFSRSGFLLVWTLLLGLSLLSSAHVPRRRSRANSSGGGKSCQRDETLLVYKVIFTGLWSRENFPKHFPDWRPKAHFSKLVGRSHNENFKLFRMEEEVTKGVRLFAESGTSDVLNEFSQGGGEVFDEFNATPIPSIGETETEFFVDGNHSRVSLMARLVPSPDWFVGLDSIDLCNDGIWVSSLAIEGYPLDAGTDNGLTFTSPNWRTEPPQGVSRLTSTKPNHPASSFFYPDVDQLPPIASFQFIKVKEYELSQVFNLPALKYETDSINDVYSSRINLRPLETNVLKFNTAASYSKKPRLSNEFVAYVTQMGKNKKGTLKNKRRKMKKFRRSRNSHSRRHHRPLFNWTAS